jgi:hypothetical protein
VSCLHFLSAWNPILRMVKIFDLLKTKDDLGFLREAVTPPYEVE